MVGIPKSAALFFFEIFTKKCLPTITYARGENIMQEENLQNLIFVSERENIYAHAWTQATTESLNGNFLGRT